MLLIGDRGLTPWLTVAHAKTSIVIYWETAFFDPLTDRPPTQKLAQEV